MWSDGWKIMAAGVVVTGEEVIWYCISYFDADDAREPDAPVELPRAA